MLKLIFQFRQLLNNALAFFPLPLVRDVSDCSVKIVNRAGLFACEEGQPLNMVMID